ncbi:3-dehydroquinate synthase [Paludibaculum fermentans]|uniref:3-dehydroquinate synthase n=1 Tax=Paludibaculum fermentans TaxID=1473598 RepID=UPI003EC0AB3F
MPAFAVTTTAHRYEATVERGVLRRLRDFLPARHGKVFVVATDDVWALHGPAVASGLDGKDWHRLVFPGGEERKRLSSVESMADRMVELGGDRSSLVVAFGGGIVNDLGGFLAAIYMRGIPVIQIPTTLLSQVDAAVGGKTGANLVGGKNLIGSFHQPLAVLTDPDVLATLPEREYRAGLFEVIKHGVIACEPLFRLMQNEQPRVMAREPGAVEQMVAESVRIKCEVVTADEKEMGLRKILNFGHTVGHAMEAETKYAHFLHGEAVGLGMIAATHLSRLAGRLSEDHSSEIIDVVNAYGPFPSTAPLSVDNLMPRLVKDKKAIQGTVHFVLATGIGSTEVVPGLPADLVREAIGLTLA